MNPKNPLIKIALFAGFVLLFFFAGLIIGKVHNNNLPADYLRQQDTLRFLIRDLKKDIISLKEQRQAVAIDTQRIINKYDALFRKILADKSDSAQLAMLRQLLNKPNPEPVDVNTAIAQGQECCELLDNSKHQLRLCDSAGSRQDLIIKTQETDNKNCREGLLQEEIKTAGLKADLVKEKKHLKGWRKVALTEGVAAILAGAIFYLIK